MSSVPSDAQLWQAIDVYLRHAYPSRKPPDAVQAKIDVLRSTCGSLLKSAAFESSAGADKRALRLGNAFFPHMKLVVERRGGEFFFRADAHDAHCRPPEGSREMTEYQDLVRRNREVSAAIESEWTSSGLPTFKTFLREDLARRHGTSP